MSAEYAVRVEYVDTTYWDDGSRWTSQTFTFLVRTDAVAFARAASAEGCKVRGQNGELHVFPTEASITVERRSTVTVKWKGEEAGLEG